jgi:hypothetical protein
MKELKAFDDRALLEGYVAQAAWFWFDASTEEKKLEVGFRRLVARCIYEELRDRGLKEPGPAELYAQARKVFPPDDLHAWNQSGYHSHLDISPSPGW